MRRAVLARSFQAGVGGPQRAVEPRAAESPSVRGPHGGPHGAVARVAERPAEPLQPGPSTKLLRKLRGHDGWVWDVAMDAGNDWFATASADKTIKVWSLASGELKVTLTGHLLPVRGLAVSAQLSYMFSGGEDKKLLCWDLEYNKPTRAYHGHRSGIYSVALHPEIPYLLASGSRDSSVRLWDVRSRAALRVLNHDGPVNKVLMQGDDTQLVSASQDRTVKLWDIAGGGCLTTLTQHTHSVRALAIHPLEYTFVSGARDGIRQWRLPAGDLLGEFDEPPADDGLLSLSCGADSRVFAGYESDLRVYDYTSGALIERLDPESPVLSSIIDRSGTRLITTHMDTCVRTWRIR